MASFLTLGDMGDGDDDLSHFRQLLEVAQIKAESCGYAERRAQELANSSGLMEDNFSLEDEIQMAMEEIHNKEKDLKQLVQTAQFLLEHSEELSTKNEEQAVQITTLLNEQTLKTDSVANSEARADSLNRRVQQLEQIGVDLERQLQD